MACTNLHMVTLRFPKLVQMALLTLLTSLLVFQKVSCTTEELSVGLKQNCQVTC